MEYGFILLSPLPMTLAAVAEAIRIGSPAALARAMTGVDLALSPPQRAAHPVWAWVERFQSAPPDYPWEEMVTTWVAQGGPVNPLLEPPAATWKKAEGKEAARFAMGRSVAGRHNEAPQVLLLRRAVAFGATAAVRAWLKAGASPWQEIPERWPGEAVRDNGAAWYALTGGRAELARALLDGNAEPLPATRHLASWLLHTGPRWPVDHPLWHRLPLASLASWQQAFLSEWRSDHAPAVGGWWQACPGDRAILAPLLAAAQENPWSGILPSLFPGESIPPDLQALPARADLHARVGPAAGPPARRAVPALQWARHAPSLGVPKEDAASDLRAAGVSLFATYQPSWTAAGEGDWTEGELAELWSTPHHPSHLVEDDAVWAAHPEWMAPHARTGRTPLWHAQDAVSAHRWWRRGCALDAVDAEGNQVFTLLVARAMMAGRAGSDLGTWALDRLRTGDAPSEGIAWGRPLSEWVLGRTDLASALARRTAHAPSQPSTALFVRAARLDKKAVLRLLQEGACPDVVDAAGQTPLLAALRATTEGPAGRRAKRDIVSALFRAGASYHPPGAQAALPVEVMVEKPRHLKQKESQGILGEVILQHAKADAPWSPQLASRVMEQAHSLWGELPLSTQRAWRSVLLDPHWQGTSEMGRDVFVRARWLLAHALPHLNGDGALDAGEPWRAWCELLRAGTHPRVQELWNEWTSTPQGAAHWSAVELDLGLDVALPSQQTQARRPRM